MQRLPGFGRRSAMRAALALVREPLRLLEPLASALEEARREVRVCSRCGSFTVASEDPCKNCTDPSRDASILCIVEDPADIVTIEASGAYRGRYHALGGKLSPSHKVGPEKLRLDVLPRRITDEGFKEVLLALSTDMDGDATALYIAGLVKPSGVKISRLAFGLPADSGIAYSDPLTLRRAIRGRMDV